MNAKDVLELENELSFDSFCNEDAYHIANIIIKLIKEKGLRNCRIRAVIDGELVYQYLMDGKTGEMWLDRKQKTIEKFGHSSYYVFLKNEEDASYKEYENDESIVLCGGGFPIIVNHKMIGSFIVSGLAHRDDHQLLIDAFREYKGTHI